MSWLTQAGGDSGPILVSATFIKNTEVEERWSLDDDETIERRTRTRSVKTTVEEFRCMAQGAAILFADGEERDDYDIEDESRTTVVAEVFRANDAGAYTVARTTTTISAWSAWSANWDED